MSALIFCLLFVLCMGPQPWYGTNHVQGAIGQLNVKANTFTHKPVVYLINPWGDY